MHSSTRKCLGLVLACALGLGGCVINSPAARPQAVADQPDTFRFRVYPTSQVLEGMFADRAADEEIGKFRAANGYAASTVVARDYRDLAFVYTVRFSR